MSDHKLTEEKFIEFKEAFEIFDRNKDGFITRDELAELIRTIGHDIGPSELEGMFNEVDIEKNSNIDFKEYLGLMASRNLDHKSGDDYMEAFKLFDRDNDQVISAKDLMVVMNLMGEEMNEEQAKEMIREADTNKDDQLHYEEFYSFITKK